MPIIIPSSEAIQGGEKWMALRVGIPTASEFKNFMDGDFEFKKAKKAGDINASVWTYLCKKLAERWSGSPLAQFQGTWEMEQGKEREKLARKWIALTYDEWDVQEVAFVQTDDKKAGASPDGLIGSDNGLELKCLESPHHIACVMEGVLPEDYKHQVFGSMWVTGRPLWTFCAYRQDFPSLVLTVERDEAIMSRIGESVRQFNLLLDAAFEKLKRIP